MILKIFTQPHCPACPPAKLLGEKLQKKVKVEFYDVTESKGLAEATLYGVMATPTLILLDDQEEVKKTWTGTPSEEEVVKEL